MKALTENELPFIDKSGEIAYFNHLNWTPRAHYICYQ